MVEEVEETDEVALWLPLPVELGLLFAMELELPP